MEQILTIADLMRDRPVEVELRGECADGKPPRLQMRQLTNMQWVTQTNGLPLVMRAVAGGDGVPDDIGAKIQNVVEAHEYKRRVLAYAITAYEIAVDDPAVPGGYVREWTPVRFTAGTPGEGETSIDDFDRRDNFERAFAALQNDWNNGGPAALIAGQVFRE